MQFLQYICRNTWMIIGVTLITVLCQGRLLLLFSVGIDTEAIMVDKESLIASWLTIGRQGLVLLKFLTEDGTLFSPLYAGARTVIFLVLTCILWGYLFTEVAGKDHKIAAATFGVILVTHPILSEQFYFKLQAAEVALSFALMAVCLLHAHRFALTKCVRFGIVAYLLMLLLFSVYQVMNALFLFGMVVCFFLHFIYREEWWIGREIWRYVWRVGALFILGFTSNQVIARLWFTGTDYISSQVRWGVEPVTECLLQMIRHVVLVCLGRGLYSETYVFLAVGGICFAVFLCKKKREANHLSLHTFIAIGSMLFIVAGPFYMTFISGGETVLRSQLVLPFCMASLGYCVVLYMKNMQRRWNVLWIVILFLTVLLQGMHSIALGRTEAIRYDSDVRRARQIHGELQEMGIPEGTPLVFIGGLEEQEDYIYGDCIGQSIFAWDVEVEPYSYHSSRRILGFFYTRGYQYAYPTPEQVAKGVDISEEMATWPAKGSIRIEKGYVIVNFR